MTEYKCFDVYYSQQHLRDLKLPLPSDVFKNIAKARSYLLSKRACIVVGTWAGIGSIRAPKCNFCHKLFHWTPSNDQFEHTCVNPITRKRNHCSQQVFVGTPLQPTAKYDVTKIFQFLLGISANRLENKFITVAEQSGIQQPNTVSKYYYNIFAPVCAYSMSCIGLLGGDFTNPCEIDGYHEGKR